MVFRDFHTVSASMVVTDQFVLCKAALIFAVTRWLLSFALNLLTTSVGIFSSESSDSSTQASTGSSCCSSSSSSAANLKLVRDSLSLTTLGSIQHCLPESRDLSCAVCLNNMRKSSKVWQLRNCSHVFHKQCLERWLSYDNRMTCPLCRAPLVTVSSSASPDAASQPSWAVERMLYLFGDDLLP